MRRLLSYITVVDAYPGSRAEKEEFDAVCAIIPGLATTTALFDYDNDKLAAAQYFSSTSIWVSSDLPESQVQVQRRNINRHKARVVRHSQST